MPKVNKFIAGELAVLSAKKDRDGVLVIEVEGDVDGRRAQKLRPVNFKQGQVALVVKTTIDQRYPALGQYLINVGGKNYRITAERLKKLKKG